MDKDNYKSEGSLSHRYDIVLADVDRENPIVISDDEDNESSKIATINDNEDLSSSGRNSFDLSVVRRESSEEQLENSIQKAIERTIKRFSNSSVSEILNDKTEKEPGDAEADDVSDDDEVFINGYRRRFNAIDDSSDDEVEIVGENVRHSDLESAKSKKSSDDECSSKDSPEQLRHKLKRKKRFVRKTDSSDDDIPSKKRKLGLSERSISPEYGLPRKENSDESEIYDILDTTEEAAHYISEGGGSKDRSPKSHNSIPIDESAKEENFLDKTVESGRKSFNFSDDEINEYANSSHSSRSQSEMNDSYIHSEGGYRHEIDSISSEEFSTSDNEDDEDYLPEDYGQQRAVLLDKKQEIDYQLSTMKMLLKTRNVRLDKAKQLRQRIESKRNKLLKISEALKKLETERRLEQLNYVSPKTTASQKSSLFKDNSFEMDPAYLTPKLGSIDKKLGKKAQETMNREQSLTVERLQDLHGSLLAGPVENQRATDPRGLKVALMPHQQHALAWLQWREQQNPRGGVLADEMGLGKTLTMIALVMASIAKDNDGEGSENEDEWKSSARGQRHLGGTLVVVPASLLAQWEAEVKTRCKRDVLTVELYHGAKRETVPKRLAKNDIVITTYNIVCREYKIFGVLFKIRWRRVILDEAHVIRNHKSQPCLSVCGLYTNKRWAVTGTPLHNKEMDLYSLLKFLQCSPFDDVRVWKRWVDNRNDAGHERLATVMKTLMLRRTKQELQAKGELPPLPDKNVQVIEVELDHEERLVYDKVMLYSRTLFAQFLTQRAEKVRTFEFGRKMYEGNSWKDYRRTQFTKAQNKLLSLHADVQAHEILVLLIRLRQVCCHPSLIKAMLDRNDIELQAGTDSDIFSKMKKMKTDENDDEEDTDDFEIDERVAEHLLTVGNPVFDTKRQSSKMRAVISKVEEVLDKGDKIIIVSQWVGVLNIVAMELDSVEGASYRMFTGQVAVKNRQDILDDFNSQRANPNILLLSLNAGGVGLNLIGANHMLLVDIHWNPQLESQAQDRIHRFGQTKDVSIYKYICTDTIEERIQSLQNKKLELARQVLSGTGKVIGSKLSLDDIKSLFGV